MFICTGRTVSMRMFDAERHPVGLISPGGKEIDKLISLSMLYVFLSIFTCVCGG